MNRYVYISISLVGIIISILEYTVEDNQFLASSILLLTITLLGLLYFLDEWRYYRRHDALLASIQFLVVPIGILLAGSILAPKGIYEGIIDFQLEFLFVDIFVLFKVTSTILIIPSLMILSLTARYYDGRYPGFVIRRRTFGRLTFPLIIHILTLTGLIYISSYFAIMDFIVFLFIIASLIQFASKLIAPLITTRRSDIGADERRGFLNTVLSSSPSSSRRNRRNRSRGSSSSSSSGRNGEPGAPVSTRPSGGYRDIPTRSRSESTTGNQQRSRRNQSEVNQSSSRSRSPRRRRRSTRRTRTQPDVPIAEVDQGIDVEVRSKPAKKVSKSKLSYFLPRGNYDKDELRCIVCYQDFDGRKSNNIIVCPNCRYPAHEAELRAWLNQSENCPRCNKKIKGHSALRSTGLISERQYRSLINRL